MLEIRSEVIARLIREATVLEGNAETLANSVPSEQGEPYQLARSQVNGFLQEARAKRQHAQGLTKRIEASQPSDDV
jgi:hypothetical protein